MTMTSPRTTRAAEDCVEDACRWIEARVLDDSDGVLVLAELADALDARPDALAPAPFVRRLGVTPRQYADTVRRERLRDELRSGTDVSGALYAAGYGSSSRLYESAHTHLGMTPASYKAGGAGATIAWTTTSTDLGRLLVAATERGLCFILLGDSETELEADLHAEFPAACSTATTARSPSSWTRCCSASRASPAPADIPLDITGTAFQRRVWEALRHIPYGEVRTYGEIAETSARPTRCVRSAPRAARTRWRSSCRATGSCRRAAASATTGSGPTASARCSRVRARQSAQRADPRQPSISN